MMKLQDVIDGLYRNGWTERLEDVWSIALPTSDDPVVFIRYMLRYEKANVVQYDFIRQALIQTIDVVPVSLIHVFAQHVYDYITSSNIQGVTKSVSFHKVPTIFSQTSYWTGKSNRNIAESWKAELAASRFPVIRTVRNR